MKVKKKKPKYSRQRPNIEISPALNPLNAKLNPICHFPAFLGAHHILRFSRIRVNTINGISHSCERAAKVIVLYSFNIQFYRCQILTQGVTN
jgi:hypothetical protein